jgi:hypothetical protein
VAGKGAVDFLQHRLGQAFVADHGHRLFGMGEAFQGLALRRGKLDHGVG